MPESHYPECSVEQGTDHVGRDATIVWRNGVCICDRLRACEARVVKEVVRSSEYQGAKWNAGYAAGLDAARDAVTAVLLLDECDDYLAASQSAIDALRGESNG